MCVLANPSAVSSFIVSSSPSVSLPTRLAEQLFIVTHLRDVLVKGVNRSVGVLAGVLGGLVELVRGVLAVLLELLIDFRGFVLRVADELIHLRASFGCAGLGVLLCFLRLAGEVLLHLAGELRGIGWKRRVLVCWEARSLMTMKLTFGLLLGDLGVTAGLIEVVACSGDKGSTAHFHETT